MAQLFDRDFPVHVTLRSPNESERAILKSWVMDRLPGDFVQEVAFHDEVSGSPSSLRIQKNGAIFADFPLAQLRSCLGPLPGFQQQIIVTNGLKLQVEYDKICQLIRRALM